MANRLIINKILKLIVVVGVLTTTQFLYAQSIDTLQNSQIEQSDNTQEFVPKKELTKRQKKRLKRLYKKYDIDTTKIFDRVKMDSLRKSDPIAYVVDSLSIAGANFDNVNRDSIFRQFFTDTLVVSRGSMSQFNTARSLSNVRKLDSLFTVKSLADKKIKRVLNEQQDTMSLFSQTLVSTIVPGFAQIRNKEYWKLPILYGVSGGFAGLGFWTNNKLKDVNSQIATAQANNAELSEINALEVKAQGLKTQQIVYFGVAIANYLYFIGDGISNYQTKSHSPGKAALMGLFIPGGGQIYNKSYWKLPIYYGGLTAFGYILSYNSNGYNRYKTAYDLVNDGDPDTVDEFNGRYSASQLKSYRDNFRRSRDLSIFYLTGFYALGILEAYVDAHFKTYDISDNLAMKISPSVGVTPDMIYSNKSPLNSVSVGMSVNLSIKP